MPLALENLDDQTRKYMLEEIESDIASPQRLFMSSRLSSNGHNDYPSLLKQAVESHDDEWLANQLQQNGRLNAMEQRKTKSGFTNAKVPYNANEMLAEGEFNRFYIRGLCKRALDEGIAELVVYRAKQVSNPRPESQAKIGARINAQSLLNDLRAHQGIDTALGLPSGPNSGLSVKLP
jgi:hypothetical protein